MQDQDVYQRARVRARRTTTFRLRRQEHRLVVHAHTQRPTSTQLARLAAVRSELRARGVDPVGKGGRHG
jgi:hypothetical protein